MSSIKTTIVMLSVGGSILVLSSKISIDPAWETTKINLAVKEPRYAPVDEGFEPQGDIERGLLDQKTADEEIIVIEREPTIVDGTKKQSR